jgi:hypothetical protein
MPAAISLEDNWSGVAPLRLVLPRDKRDRLTERMAMLRRPRPCSVATCGAEGMAVVLVDAELEAILCPIHQLVSLEGRAVEGEPALVMAAW